jgi:alkaline phosphatase
MVGLANTGTTGYMTTHSEDRLVTDSAAAGTALATGSKTSNGVVGMSSDGERLKNLFERALEKGKAVGLVTTTSVTDATPASFLAHAPSREMHFEIASQILESDASVVMGGGYWYFLPPKRGRRSDGEDLTERARERGFEVVYDREELERARGERLLGLFASDVLPYEGARRSYETPSLSDMLTKALQVVTKDPDGFLLVVEGGRIDHAEHENKISDALADFFAFDDAIGHAMNYQEGDSTVTILVTADHDCGGPAITATLLGYPSYDDLESLVGENCPFVRWISDNHTGTMVPVFARGPGTDVFSGIQDNTDIHDNIVWLLGL